MKILYIDLLSPLGHKNFNYSLLKSLNKLNNTNIDLVFKEDYLNDFKEIDKFNKIFEIPKIFFPDSLSHKNKFLYKFIYRINFFRELNWVQKNIDIENYDFVIFSSIEVISFSLKSHFFNTNKTRIIFIDHSVGEIKEDYIKRFFWLKINGDFETIVMENYIKRFLSEEIKINNKIWVLPHPLPEINKKRLTDNFKEENVIFAPSNSNDEKFISFLIENYSDKEKFKINIRSNKYDYDSKKLNVYNNRISYDEYYKLMSKCRYILLPYKKDYNYRVSGVFFEAIMFKKPIIIHRNNTLKYYENASNDFVYGFSEYKNFLQLIKRLDNKKRVYNFEKLIFKHSEMNLKSLLENILINGSA